MAYGKERHGIQKPKGITEETKEMAAIRPVKLTFELRKPTLFGFINFSNFISNIRENYCGETEGTEKGAHASLRASHNARYRLGIEPPEISVSKFERNFSGSLNGIIPKQKEVLV